MSKKLIAVASAAALALTGLVGVAPANATAPTFTFTHTGANGETASTAATVSVERANAVATTVTGMALNLGTINTGDVVRIVASGGVRILTAAVTGSADLDASKLGRTEISFTSGGSADASKTYYAFTKSTATGSVAVTVTRTGLTYTKTLYMKGVLAATAEYNITEVTGMPATLAKNATAAITFKVTDAFGNAVEDDTSIKNTATITVGGTAIGTAPTWDATAKVYKATITSPSNSVFIVTIDTATADPTVDGLPDANWRNTSVVNNASVAAQITALTAQVAALTADYNALVKKWNKRVASKTAPKKKAALK
jgi:hypothetical protein